MNTQRPAKKKIRTRFRAYKLPNAGSSFSYATDVTFTLCEARYNEINKPSILEELEIFGKKTIDVLHITSWDIDHCSPAEIEDLLSELKPKKIEIPGYEPHSEGGSRCKEIIEDYKENQRLNASRNINLVEVNPPYIKSLKTAVETEFYTDLYYWPKELSEKSNNNSTAALFRTGAFNVLSLGDLEDENIAASLRRKKHIKNEVDILILSHHGSNNAFNRKKFLEAVSPKLAIALSDYDNQYGHPKEEVDQDLYDLEIKKMTTKTGDIVIESSGGNYKVDNYDGKTINTYPADHWLKPKKNDLLSHGLDFIRQYAANAGGFTPPKR